VLRVPKVLVLMCDTDQRAILQKVLEPHADLTCAYTPEEMSEQLERASYDAVFCARSLSMGSWREVLEEVRQFYPQLPVIIVSRTADEREWLEILEAGAFDLLTPPYHQRALLYVLAHAMVSHDAHVAREGESSKSR